MTKLRCIVFLIGALAISSITRAQDLRQKLVGKSPCAPEIQSEQSDFSLRLDKIRNAELRYRDMGRAKVVMIVEYKNDGPACGVIRDVVQISRPAKHFEFRCFDAQAPSDVVLGTAVRKYGDVTLVKAIDAWIIDLKSQKFVQTNHKVVCSADGWDGEDDGGDMVSEAHKYAAHHKPGQFEPESER